MKFLGIDVGTGGTRAVVMDESGAIIAAATAEHADFSSPEIGWAEQSPDDWWRAAVEAIREVLTVVRAEEIAAVGFSGQMHGSVLLDESDEPLRPALLWCDQRTENQCRAITEKIGAENLIKLVSNPAITGFTLPKLLWVRENEPEIWARVKTVLLPKDYVRLKLSGEKASDVADSSGTLLFDVTRRRWSDEMLARLEIDAAILPPVYESIETTGTISAQGAEETGLKVGTKIVAGAGDNQAGAVGMGLTRIGTVGATIGTSGVVFGVTDAPKLDLKGRIHTLCHAIPERWNNTGVTLAAGLSLKWFRAELGGGKTFDELTTDAAQISAGADGALWLPYLMGERTPHLDAAARAAFIGLTANHTKAHLTRAVMEGVAFSLRDALEIFKESGANVEKIRLGGGGAKSPLWRQIQADVYGKEVEILAADEGAAHGAAILAGVGAGNWKTVDEACEQAIRVAETIEPNAKNIEILDERFSVYRRIYPAMFSIFHSPFKV